MKKLITEFNLTGPCTVDVEKVAKAWTNKFTILQHEDSYRLIKYGRGENCAKVTIAKEQALQIIEKCGLKTIQDSFFRLAKSYKKKEFIQLEIERLTKVLMNSTSLDEKRVINGVVDSYIKAIS